MKILMTADTVGGVWTFALDLACALHVHGTSTVLATMGTPLSPAQRRAAERVPELSVVESDYRLEWMDDPWNDVEAAAAWLLDLEARTHPDVVHLNGYAHGAVPFKAPIVITAHSCVCSWWEAVKGGDAPGSYDRYRHAVTSGLRGAAAIVAPSRAMAGAIERLYAPPRTVQVIHNGRNASLLRGGTKEHIVLSAGRLWDEAKNIHALADAARSLAWPVFVAGDAAGREPERSVFWLGSLPPAALAEWYGRAAIYALPARYEPFGLSVLEAALAGCALVLGDIPSLREIWDDAATYVEPGDPAALANAIDGLMRERPRREAMATRARARAARYDLDTTARAYLAEYEAVRRARSASGGAVACAS